MCKNCFEYGMKTKKSKKERLEPDERGLTLKRVVALRGNS